jgi:hypothetical protein
VEKNAISRNEFIGVMLRLEVAIPVPELHKVWMSVSRE